MKFLDPGRRLCPSKQNKLVKSDAKSKIKSCIFLLRKVGSRRAQRHKEYRSCPVNAGLSYQACSKRAAASLAVAL